MFPPLFVSSSQKKPLTVVLRIQINPNKIMLYLNSHENKKSPLIKRSKDVNYVVPPFFVSTSRILTLSGHLTTTAAITGFPDFPTLFQKIDSKMCFTINCYLFSPTRDSLKTFNRYFSFRCRLF